MQKNTNNQLLPEGFKVLLPEEAHKEEKAGKVPPASQVAWLVCSRVTMGESTTGIFPREAVLYF